MIYKNKLFFLAAILFVSASMLWKSAVSEEIDTKIGGFRFYLTDDDGTQRGVVNGFKADFVSPDEIEITDASAQITDLGKHPVLIQTPSCIFFKSRSEIKSELPVVIRTVGVEINGIGMQWQLEKKILVIEKDVIVDGAKSMQGEFDDE